MAAPAEDLKSSPPNPAPTNFTAVFDYLRDNVFDSRGFFSPVTPINRQNEYGVAFGGPLWIPRVYDGRTRTFFHFVYSGFRYDASAANTLIRAVSEIP
jgi:hypothetical protein